MGEPGITPALTFMVDHGLQESAPFRALVCPLAGSLSAYHMAVSSIRLWQFFA